MIVRVRQGSRVGLAVGVAQPNDSSRREWAGRYPAAAGFERLWCGQFTDEAYRIAWMPSYRSSLTIEVARHDDEWRVTAVEFRDPRQVPVDRGQGRFQIVGRQSTRASGTTLSSFVEVVSRSGVWAEGGFINSGANDGTEWMLEAKRRDEYQAQYRATSPSPESTRLARAFVEVAGRDWASEVRRRE